MRDSLAKMQITSMLLSLLFLVYGIIVAQPESQLKKLVVRVEERREKSTETGFSGSVGRAFTFKHLIFRLNNYSVHHSRFKVIEPLYFCEKPDAAE